MSVTETCLLGYTTLDVTKLWNAASLKNRFDDAPAKAKYVSSRRTSLHQRPRHVIHSVRSLQNSSITPRMLDGKDERLQVALLVGKWPFKETLERILLDR